jgi:hypothetical protein
MSGTGIISTLTASQQIELVYVGYFNRSGDSAGFFYWGNEYSTDLSHGQTATQALNQIANEFKPQAETLALYPFLATSNPPTNPSEPGWASWVANVNTLVQNVYTNLFDRAADSAGLTYWTNQIATGAVPLGEAILAIANGATDSASGNDATLLTNKVTAALDFTSQTGAAGLGVTVATTTPALIQEASQVLTLVTTDPASVTAAHTATATWISSGAGSTIDLTIGVDHVIGQNVIVNGVINNDIIASNNSTLNPTDTFHPTGANNTLNVTILGSLSPQSDITPATTPVLNNIQTLNVTNNSTVFHTNSLQAITPALTALNVVNGLSGNWFQGINGAQVQTYGISGVANAGTFEGFATLAGLTSAATGPTGTAALTLSNNAKNLDVQFAGAAANDGIANLTVHSNGTTANALSFLTDPELKVLTIDGAAALSVTNAIGFFNGKVDIEAAAATGALTLDVSNNTGKVVFNGSTTALNTFTISEASLVTAGTALNAGTGAGNTLEVLNLGVASAADATAINATHGFDTLGLIDPANTIDASKITVLKHYVAEVGNGTDTITNLASGSTVDLVRGNAFDTFSGLVHPGQALNLNLNPGNALATGLTETANVLNQQVLNVTSTGSTTNTLNLTGVYTDTGGAHITVSGAEALDLTLATAAGTVGATINASGLTGNFILGSTGAANPFALAAGETVNFGNSTTGHGDTITSGTGQNLIVETHNENLLPAVQAADSITLSAGHGVSTIASNVVPNVFNEGSAVEAVHGFTLGADQVALVTPGILVSTLNIGTGADVGLAAGQVNANGLITSGFANTTAFLHALSIDAAASVGDLIAFNDGAGDIYVAEATGVAAGNWHVVELVGQGSASTGFTIAAGHGVAAVA